MEPVAVASDATARLQTRLEQAVFFGDRVDVREDNVLECRS